MVSRVASGPRSERTEKPPCSGPWPRRGRRRSLRRPTTTANPWPGPRRGGPSSKTGRSALSPAWSVTASRAWFGPGRSSKSRSSLSSCPFSAGGLRQSSAWLSWTWTSARPWGARTRPRRGTRACPSWGVASSMLGTLWGGVRAIRTSRTSSILPAQRPPRASLCSRRTFKRAHPAPSGSPASTPRVRVSRIISSRPRGPGSERTSRKPRGADWATRRSPRWTRRRVSGPAVTCSLSPSPSRSTWKVGPRVVGDWPSEWRGGLSRCTSTRPLGAEGASMCDSSSHPRSS